jgi:hypothetical protein
MQVQGSARAMAGYLDYLSRAPHLLIFASIAPPKITQIANPTAELEDYHCLSRGPVDPWPLQADPTTLSVTV